MNDTAAWQLSYEHRLSSIKLVSQFEYIYNMRRQNNDVSMAPGGREQVRLQCLLEGAF